MQILDNPTDYFCNISSELQCVSSAKNMCFLGLGWNPMIVFLEGGQRNITGWGNCVQTARQQGEIVSCYNCDCSYRKGEWTGFDYQSRQRSSVTPTKKSTPLVFKAHRSVFFLFNCVFDFLGIILLQGSSCLLLLSLFICKRLCSGTFLVILPLAP